MGGDETNRPNILSSNEECDGLGRKGRERGESAEESRDHKQRRFRRDFAMQRKQLDEKSNQIAADEISGQCSGWQRRPQGVEEIAQSPSAPCAQHTPDCHRYGACHGHGTRPGSPIRMPAPTSSSSSFALGGGGGEDYSRRSVSY